jgi:hypothetical protein
MKDLADELRAKRGCKCCAAKIKREAEAEAKPDVWVKSYGEWLPGIVKKKTETAIRVMVRDELGWVEIFAEPHNVRQSR